MTGFRFKISSIEKAFDPLAWEGEKIPLPPNKEINLLAKKMRHKSIDEYVKRYGWTLPTRELFEKVLEHMQKSGAKKLLGLCSGGACIESLFQLAGLDVVATDKDTSMDGVYMTDSNSANPRGRFRMDVKELDVSDAIAAYPNHALFVSWATQASLRSIGNALRTGEIPPGTLIFMIDPLPKWRDDFFNQLFAKNLALIEQCPLASHPNTKRSHLHAFRVLGRN